MGKIYSVDAVLSTDLTPTNIELILGRGTLLGLKYYEKTMEVVENPIELSPQEATKKIIEINRKRDFDEEALDATYGKSSFGLAIFQNEPGSLVISFMAIDGDTEMKNGYRMDYDRFIRLMLDMIKDLPIIKLEASSF